MSKLEFKIKLDDAKEAERWKEFYKVEFGNNLWNCKTNNIGVVVIKRKNHLNLMDITALATYSIIIKSLHQLFFKIFYGSSIYRKRNNKELFFLMIDADNFQITAGGDYSVPAVKTPCPAAAGRSGFRRFIWTCHSNHLTIKILGDCGGLLIFKRDHRVNISQRFLLIK